MHTDAYGAGLGLPQQGLGPVMHLLENRFATVGLSYGINSMRISSRTGERAGNASLQKKQPWPLWGLWWEVLWGGLVGSPILQESNYDYI